MKKLFALIISFGFLAFLISANANSVVSENKFSDEIVKQWANEAAVTVYSYNYLHYEKETKKMSHYFTKNGWQNFLSAFKKSGNLDTVKQKKILVSAVATSPPTITEHPSEKNNHTWDVTLPLSVHHQSSNEVVKHQLLITMKIVKSKKDEGVRGLALTELIAKPNKE